MVFKKIQDSDFLYMIVVFKKSKNWNQTITFYKIVGCFVNYFMEITN